MQVISLILTFLGAISGPFFLVLFGIVWIAAAAYCGIAAGYASDRKRVKKWLVDFPERAKAYRWMVGSILASLQAAAKPGVQKEEKEEDGFFGWLSRKSKLDVKTNQEAVRISSNPWGWPVFDFALRLAIIYPAGFSILLWMITGSGANIGEGKLFIDANLLERLASCVIVLVAVALISGSAHEKLGIWAWPIIVVFCLLFGFLRNVELGAFNRILENAAFGAVLVPILLFGIRNSGLFVGIVCAFSTSIFTVLISPVDNVIEALLLTVLVLTFSFFVGSIIYFLITFLIRNGMGFLACLLCSAFWCGSVIAASFVLSRYEANIVLRSGFLYIGILPFVNAVFDYVSYALTLTLVRLGIRSKGWLAVAYGALDVVLAALLFSVLGATLVAIMAFLDRTATGSAYPVNLILDGIAERKSEFFWVYGMLFSTFLPTIIHLSLSSLTLVSVVPKTWRTALWVEFDAQANDWLKRAGACAGIGALFAVALTAPIAIFWGLAYTILTNSQTIGIAYLSFFRFVATIF